MVNSISAQRSNKEVGTTMGLRLGITTSCMFLGGVTVWLLVPNVSDESDVILYL